MANLNTIKSWFKTGLRPTSSQFSATWDSFFHKDDTIPVSKIENLDNRFSDKTDKEVFQFHEGSDEAHNELFTGLRNEFVGLSTINFKGLAERDTVPEIPTFEVPLFYQALAGITYDHFFDSFGNAIVVPLKIGDKYVVNPRLISVSGSWEAVWELVDGPAADDFIKKIDAVKSKEVDRPDKTDSSFVMMNEKKEVLFDSKQNFLDLAKEVSLLNGSNRFDRPDLKAAFVTTDGYILSVIKADETTEQSEINYGKPFYNPRPQAGFSQTDPLMTDYSLFSAAWDSFLIEGIHNPEIPAYVTKTVLGKTSTKNMDVVRFDFEPENPTCKVLIIGGTHASEKIFMHHHLNFFKLLTDANEWANDSVLTWLRYNVHFVVIPCLCPSSFEGFLPGTIGGRRPWECDDFPVSWTKSGSEVTITFNAADFPNTNGRLDANTYFSTPGIAGKLDVALFNSSNQAGLPDNGYRIKSVINGRTIVVDAPSSGGAGSGIARLYVGVDPNRNTSDGGDVWANYIPSSTSIKKYPNDHVAYANDNKGTKPFALAETGYLRDMIAEEMAKAMKFLFLYDGHSGSGPRYAAWSEIFKPLELNQAIQNIKYISGQFTNGDFSNIRIHEKTVPFFATYLANKYPLLCITIEWSQDSTTDEQESTESFRWFTTVLTESIKVRN